METSPVVPTGPNTAVAQVHRQILLVVVVGRVAAAPGAATADSSAGRGQSTGPFHGAAGLLKGQGPGGLWSGVVDMVDEVVSVAVVVNVAPGLLRGRRLQAA